MGDAKRQSIDILMAKTESFDLHADAYEAWFEAHQLIYEDEVRVLKGLSGGQTNGLDIGMGSGRFALPLGISIGVEPSRAMREIAVSKGLHPIDGTAEHLPFGNETFDFAVMITTICFVDDPFKAFQEAYRVIRPNGYLIIGFVDKNSTLGQTYIANKDKSRFYSEATFFSNEEIMSLAQNAGFVRYKTKGVQSTDNAFVFVQCFKPKKEE